MWPHIEVAAEARLVVSGDSAYVPSYWRAAIDTAPEAGVPTSYYTSVQFVVQPHLVDSDQEKAALLESQLADFQPEGGHGEMTTHSPGYGPMLSGIRGLDLRILRVEAKFKYDDHKPTQLRESIAKHLRNRGRGGDRRAAREQARRLRLIGDWKAFRSRGK